MTVSVEDMISIDSLLLQQRTILFARRHYLDNHRITIQIMKTNSLSSKGLSSNHIHRLYTIFLSNLL